MKIAHPGMWHRIVWRWRLGGSRCPALRSDSFSPEVKSRFSRWVELFGFQNQFEYIARNIKILSRSACLVSCPGLGLLIAYSRAGQLRLTGGPHNSYGTRPRTAIVYTYIGGGGGGIELTRTPLFTNKTFVLLLFIKVTILCSFDL